VWRKGHDHELVILWLTRFTELRTSGQSSNWGSTAVHNLIFHSFATALSAGGADKWAGMVKVREAYPKLTDQPLDESHLQRLVLKVNSDQAGRDAYFRRTSGRTNKQFRTDTFAATLDVAAAMGPISSACRAALLDLADLLDHDRLYAAAQISRFPSEDGVASTDNDAPQRTHRPILRVVKS
jgi:hypothetical protein